MKNRIYLPFLGLSLLSTAAHADATITVDASNPGTRISPTLYGIFFEEINRAGDGGIYAEMLQNRSFEDDSAPSAWTLMKSGTGEGSLALDKSQPLNAGNPTSLRLEITGAGGRVGVANEGFRGVAALGGDRKDDANSPEWRSRFEKATNGGLNIETGKTYDLAFYARATAGVGPLTATLESPDGIILASQTVKNVGANWNLYSVSLKANASEAKARLVLSAGQKGTLWLDMVSLFPKDTWKNRKNGLRPDLMNAIAATKPAFVRFPGGCFVEGDKMADATRWKTTIGDIAARPGHWDLWGYRSTDGLGYHEYLQMCEDLGAAPLFVVNCGMAHQDTVPMEQMSVYVQDALDAIEYANGPVTSKWGALRAKNGHPAPFNLKMMEIGNENGGVAYNERYALFYDAIKARDPQMQLVACDWAGGVPHSRPIDSMDSHMYSNPRNFLANATRYDNYDRKGPKIYFGEYAVTEQSGHGNMTAAIGEAAFMTGLERNGDVVKMSSYAPLLSNEPWKSWNPNAIVFDQNRFYGTPSYWVQTMFAPNRADVNLPLSVKQEVSTNFPGKIGVGTWATQAEFRDIQITKDGQTLFQNDFSKPLAGGAAMRGQWEVADGVLRQKSGENNTRVSFGDAAMSDYTLSLKARKIGGNEGFLISFQAPDDATTNWWNLGGWGNKEHGLEVSGVTAPRVPGTIETGRWYDIKIELKGDSIRCFLDGKLIHDVKRGVTPNLFAVAGKQDKTGEIVLKVVNSAATPTETTLQLKGTGKIAPDATAWVLTSANPGDENSFEAPTKIAPREEKLSRAAAQFTHVFPANSVTVLKFKVAK